MRCSAEHSGVKCESEVQRADRIYCVRRGKQNEME